MKTLVATAILFFGSPAAFPIVGEQADAAGASFLSEPVTVRVVESDGSSKIFVVGPKGLKVANATFNACVAEC